MNRIKLDPAVKMNMSLDQIIRMDKSFQRPPKKKWHRKENSSGQDISVRLVSSTGSGDIYVSKASPPVNEQKRNMRQAEVDRNLQNKSEIMKVTQKVIPASYHLIRTDTGFEKVLLPIRQNTTNKKRKPKGKFGQYKQFKKTANLKIRKKVNHSSIVDTNNVVILDNLSIDLSTKTQKVSKSEPMNMEIESSNLNLNMCPDWSDCSYNWFFPQKPLKQTLNERFSSNLRRTQTRPSYDLKF